MSKTPPPPESNREARLKYLQTIKPQLAQDFIKNWCMKYAPKPEVIFDIGALSGNQSIEFAKAFPAARVFCFEAHPLHAEACRQNTAAYKNITVIEGAVCDKHDEIMTFWRSVGNNPGGSSLFQFTEKMVKAKQFKQAPIRVRTLRLDEWAKVYKVPTCDIMWVDMQGAEGLMLAGAAPSLLESVQVVHIEAHYEPAYEGQTMAEEIQARLEAAGMVMSHWSKASSVVHCGDAIFTRVPRDKT